MLSLTQKIIRLLFHNFGYKLLSLFLAVIIWAIIQGEQVQEINRESIVGIHLAPEFGVRGELIRVKAATIRGPQAWLLEVPKKLTADIYIPSGKVGRYRIRLSKDEVKNLNERLEIIIHEPYLDLFVDKLMERSLPVKEAIHGTPADGYIIEKVNLEPKFVNIKGIRNDLMKLRYVYTEPIDVSGLNESRVLDVRLIPPGLGIDAFAIDTVRVVLQVGDSRINRRFNDIPIEVVGATKRTRIEPPSVSILVQGVPGVLNVLKRGDFKAFVDVHDLGSGRHEHDIHVKIPPDTALIESFPEKGIVAIEKD
ncbi:MAG: CdaR family protein [Proteobacteria bacterium]|nr:CdaR family protein [Pseudomonadota bacterium]